MYERNGNTCSWFVAESAKKLEAEASRLTVERDEVAQGLDEDTLALFQRVAKFRGSAMAEAADGMCQACRVKLRLQMYVELKHNQEIVQCPACNRILYYKPVAATPADSSQAPPSA